MLLDIFGANRGHVAATEEDVAAEISKYYGGNMSLARASIVVDRGKWEHCIYPSHVAIRIPVTYNNVDNEIMASDIFAILVVLDGLLYECALAAARGRRGIFSMFSRKRPVAGAHGIADWSNVKDSRVRLLHLSAHTAISEERDDSGQFWSIDIDMADAISRTQANASRGTVCLTGAMQANDFEGVIKRLFPGNAVEFSVPHSGPQSELTVFEWRGVQQITAHALISAAYMTDDVSLSTASKDALCTPESAYYFDGAQFVRRPLTRLILRHGHRVVIDSISPVSGR